MAAAETGTADFQSTMSRFSSFVLTAGADAATVSLREGSSSGTVRFVVKAALNTTEQISFGTPIVSQTGNWYVDLTAGTTPQMTIVS